MMEVQYGLIDLFEEGAANGKTVLEVTGEGVCLYGLIISFMILGKL